MRTYNAALTLIKRFEGCKLTAYKDPKGIWTIGYGATGKDIKEGVVWTKDQAEVDLLSRVAALEKKLLTLIKPKTVPDVCMDALLSLVYNIGEGAFASSTMLKKIKEGDLTDACAEFVRWRDPNTPSIEKGLLRRRIDEMTVFFSGV